MSFGDTGPPLGTITRITWNPKKTGLHCAPSRFDDTSTLNGVFSFFFADDRACLCLPRSTTNFRSSMN